MSRSLPELADEILGLKKSGPAADGYSFPRLAQYLGRWIRHSGWYPDRKTRLYNRAKAEWVGDYVHESVRVNGSVGQLRADLLHFTCNSAFEHSVCTPDRYTTLAARELWWIEKKQPVPLGAASRSIPSGHCSARTSCNAASLTARRGSRSRGWRGFTRFSSTRRR